jgi:hypothetical protein
MDAHPAESSDSNNTESHDSEQTVTDLPEEVQEFLDACPTDADYLSFDADGNILLPSKVRIDLDNGHDYGRCLLARNPKAQYDEDIGEWVFEVQVLPANQRRIRDGEIVEVDPTTMTKVVKPKYRNESRVTVVASQVTPVPGHHMLPFPIEEIRRELAVRKASDRRTGKIKPEGKGGGTVRVSDGDLLTESHFGSADTGEVFRWGNPDPEIIVPEGPQRAATMAAFAEEFASKPPTESELSSFKASHNLD